jgi:hypothetical protein
MAASPKKSMAVEITYYCILAVKYGHSRGRLQAAGLTFVGGVTGRMRKEVIKRRLKGIVNKEIFRLFGYMNGKKIC